MLICSVCLVLCTRTGMLCTTYTSRSLSAPNTTHISTLVCWLYLSLFVLCYALLWLYYICVFRVKVKHSAHVHRQCHPDSQRTDTHTLAQTNKQTHTECGRTHKLAFPLRVSTHYRHAVAHEGRPGSQRMLTIHFTFRFHNDWRLSRTAQHIEWGSHVLYRSINTEIFKSSPLQNRTGACWSPLRGRCGEWRSCNTWEYVRGSLGSIAHVHSRVSCRVDDVRQVLAWLGLIYTFGEIF